MTERLYVFCYDVSGRKQRARIARRLEDHAVRVQRSIFETRLRPAAAERLARRLARDLAPGDSLKVYAIGKEGLAHCRAYGAALEPLRADYVLA